MTITPDYQEILRYLGYGNHPADEQTMTRIRDCTHQLQKAIKPRYTYQIFDIQQPIQNETVYLPDCALSLPGQDFYELLRECRRCALMAVTLGLEADHLIRVSQSTDMSQAVILDACATELTEQLCNIAEQEILTIASKERRGLTMRFSPGYGDAPLLLQQELCRILNTDRIIGLTVTDHALLLPRKSVTAILGFTTQLRKKTTSPCNTCSMQGRCRFRKEGTTCGR